MKNYSLALALSSLLLLTACNTTTETEVVPETNNTPEETTETEIEPTNIIEEVTIELQQGDIDNPDAGNDVLVITEHDGTVTTIDLPILQPGTTEYYELAPDNEVGTVANYYSFWAGLGTVTRVDHIGPDLIIQQMNIDEPSGELAGIPCEPWQEIATLDIGTNPLVLVEPDREPLDYSTALKCNCEESSEGYFCAEL